jgi:Rrf2 family transcriptional regulator, cysteine metabolism repressor
MKFSAREQYGLRVMVELARHYGAGPVSLSQVAESEDLPLPYLEQIVGRLRESRLLDSSRGAKGGYHLAKSPQEVTVGDVCRALEGAIVPIPCVEEGSGAQCERKGICAARNVWETVHARLVDVLDSMTLASLVEGQA